MGGGFLPLYAIDPTHLIFGEVCEGLSWNVDFIVTAKWIGIKEANSL